MGRQTLKPKISGMCGEMLRRVESALSGEGVDQRAQEAGTVTESGKMDMFSWGLRCREEGSLDTWTSRVNGWEVGNGSE